MNKPNKNPNFPNVFKSFMQAGFECSTHRRLDGKRLDLINSTLHDRYVHQDYANLIRHGVKTVRDGIRWHLIEDRQLGRYDWSSFLPMLRAARQNDIQVIWDLCHYGWPDKLDIWHPDFVSRFADFAAAVAKLVKQESASIQFYTPINEISFWSWAGGDVAWFNPNATGRGFELKCQLVRASIAAIQAIRAVEPAARFVQAEPLINLISSDPFQYAEAQHYNTAQYQTWDMLRGHLCPELGGEASLLDIIGINYYPHNQAFLNGTKLAPEHPGYIQFSQLLDNVHNRFQRNILISETAAEGSLRVDWLRHICDEVDTAISRKIPIIGICLYPIVNYPDWNDDRYCETGIFESLAIQTNGQRLIYQPLAAELLKQQVRFCHIS